MGTEGSNSFPDRRLDRSGEYAESYIAQLNKLDAEIASVAQALAHSPEEKKAAYQKFLGELKEEKIQLMKENKILPPN